MFALIGVAAFAINDLRAELVARTAHVSSGADLYTLPEPRQVTTLCLGYRSALADLLFASVLVSAGIHHQEKRAFEFVDRYLDTINALDPTFRDPYRYADTLLIVQAVPVQETAYFRAREVLRRGLSSFPFDTELWESTGQFLAYLAPSHLSAPADQKAFRLEGARDLARACELVSNNENVPYHCIGAARLLDAGGERSAALQFLRRVLAVSDNPEIRAAATAYLSNTLRESAGARDTKYRAVFQHIWGTDFPFITRGAELVIGPPWYSALCAGGAVADSSAECASSWRALGEHVTADTTDSL
jgi:hypothetical protein